MKLLCLLLLIAVAPLSWGEAPAGEEIWELYYAPEHDASEAQEKVRSLLPENTPLLLRELPNRATSQEALRTQSEAVAAGVRSLPCLVLRDKEGVYAAIPVGKLTPAVLREARNRAIDPQRAEQTKQRNLAAELLLHSSTARNSSAPPESRLNALTQLENLSKQENLPKEQRQLIALRFLYPALMLYYSDRFQGSHTPETEQIFLLAVRALEYARDIAPLSKAGRLAYEERERLRAARLEAKRFD